MLPIIEAWSKRHMRPRRGFIDQDKRERELQRLLRLLQDDPAQGLRFALPIPNRIDLLGVHVFAQIYAVAPNQNPAWIVISDAVDWMIPLDGGCSGVGPYVVEIIRGELPDGVEEAA